MSSVYLIVCSRVQLLGGLGCALCPAVAAAVLGAALGALSVMSHWQQAMVLLQAVNQAKWHAN